MGAGCARTLPARVPTGMSGLGATQGPRDGVHLSLTSHGSQGWPARVRVLSGLQPCGEDTGFTWKMGVNGDFLLAPGLLL